MKYRDNMTIQECRDAIAWGRANNQPDAHLPIAIYRNRKGQISFAALSFVESFKTYKIIEVL